MFNNNNYLPGFNRFNTAGQSFVAQSNPSLPVISPIGNQILVRNSDQFVSSPSGHMTIGAALPISGSQEYSQLNFNNEASPLGAAGDFNKRTWSNDQGCCMDLESNSNPETVVNSELFLCKPEDATSFAPSLASNVPASASSIGLGFTFTSPTQANMIYATSGPEVTSFSSPRYRMSAPGLGSPWQHMVPNQMPWTMPSQLTPQPVQVFTGGDVVSSVSNPLPSCSTVPSRPKRRANHEDTENIVSKKMHLCEEKMAARLNELHIDNPSRWIDTRKNALMDGWVKMKAIEERLSDDEDDFKIPDEEGDQTLHLAQGIADILTPDPVLPSQVIENIKRPCREVILWKSPDQILSDIMVPPSSTKPLPDSSEDRNDIKTTQTDSSRSYFTSEQEDIEMFDELIL